MVFHEQSLGVFIEARTAASDLLQEAGVKDRILSFDETYIMQGVSHLLGSQPYFYGLEIVRLTGVKSGAVYPILNRFDEEYTILKSRWESASRATAHDRRPRRNYSATKLGNTVFKLFTSSPAES